MTGAADELIERALDAWAVGDLDGLEAVVDNSQVVLPGSSPVIGIAAQSSNESQSYRFAGSALRKVHQVAWSAREYGRVP